MNIFVLTGSPLTLPNHLALLQLSKSNSHGIFPRNFKILCKAHFKIDIRKIRQNLSFESFP